MGRAQLSPARSRDRIGARRVRPERRIARPGCIRYSVRSGDEKVEQRINELEIKKEDIEKEMALPSVYGDFNKLQSYKQAYDKVKAELDAVTDEWESLIEKVG